MNLTYLRIILVAVAALAAAGCSSAPMGANGSAEADEHAEGPQVVYARSEPRTVELTREFEPIRPAEVLADVKDSNSSVTDVRLQVAGLPLEIPMENVGGTTWRALFTPRQLEMLAVSGQTVRYQARIVARNDEGQTSSSPSSVEFSVRTPDLSVPGPTGSG